MSILSISRDWGVSPSIVRITTNDTLSTVTTTGYYFTQLPIVEELQNGTFEWSPTDEVLIFYTNGQGYFTYNASTGTFIPQGDAIGTVNSVQGTLGQVLVNGTWGVPVSGAVVLTTPGDAVFWNPVSGTTQTAAVGNGYVCLNAAQTTITLPTTAAFGSEIAIAGHGAGGWKLQPGAGQTIQTIVGTASTSITSAEATDTFRVLCVVANTTWLALPSTSTGLIIV